MAKYYTVEKAKFGGTTGTILPFTIQLPTTNLPDASLWKTYLPAGFLRCDGSIYKAELFPTLASVIGVGKQCKFAKNPDDIESDVIQLPDLGSKYVRCSNSSGQYLNLYLNQDETQLKVGTEIEIESLVGDSVDISYSGTFVIQQQSGNKFIGNPIFLTDTGFTQNAVLTEDEFQAHGHDADVGVFSYLGKWKDSSAVDTGENVANNGATQGSNNLIQTEGPSSSVGSPSHNHQIKLPASSEYKSKNTFSYGVPSVSVPADGLKSTITVTTEDVLKLDNAVAPYILMEYIIKI